MTVIFRLDGDSAVVTATSDGGGRYALGWGVLSAGAWDIHLAAIRRAEGRHSVQVNDSGLAVVWRNAGDYRGRHRRPKNTSDWPDGLVYLSGDATDGGVWRGVDGPYPDDPLDLAPPAPTVRSRPNPRPEE